MCLILFALFPQAAPARDCRLILAANRDEFYRRPTRPMAFWPGSPRILAGRDLKAGGTWFGVSPSGRFAALTNYRDLTQILSQAPSRGELVPKLLAFEGPISDYMADLDKTAAAYSGFNLLAGEAQGQVYWYSNQTRKIVTVEPGIHGLSNHLLNTPWPKVARGTSGLGSALDSGNLDNDTLFTLLADHTAPSDRNLPDTGVGLEWERLLAPIFIRSDTYGTRSSTLMRISNAGRIQITERTWTEDGHQDRNFAFTAQPHPPSGTGVTQTIEDKQ